MTYLNELGRLRSSSPDGDSLWFAANHPERFEGLSRRRVRLNKGGLAQLRFEGVDALELHYQGLHQHVGLASAARDYALAELGFAAVTYGGASGMLARDAEVHPVPGYILTNGVDPHGRPISFVFAGKTSKRDGSKVEEVPLLQSLNGKLVKAGMAYPMVYASLPEPVRGKVLSLAAEARAGKAGVWKKDRTTAGVEVSSLEALEDAAVWPKLFRRLAAWLGSGGGQGFADWLGADPDRDDELEVEGSRVRMSQLVVERGGKVGLGKGIWGAVVVPR